MRGSWRLERIRSCGFTMLLSAERVSEEVSDATVIMQCALLGLFPSLEAHNVLLGVETIALSFSSSLRQIIFRLNEITSEIRPYSALSSDDLELSS